MDRNTNQERKTPLEFTISNAGSIVPAASILATLLAISYNIVYLYFSNSISITPLTISDAFSKSWVMIPIVILTVIVLIISRFQIRSDFQQNPQKFKSFTTPHSNIDVLFTSIGITLVSVSPILAVVSRAIYSDDLLVFSIFASCALLFASGMSAIVLSKMKLINFEMSIMLMIYLVTVIFFSVAGYNGLSSINSRDMTLIRYGDRHIFCGHLITLVERAAIVYEPTYKVRKLIPSSTIRSVETPSACAPARKPPAVRKQPKASPSAAVPSTTSKSQN